MAGLPSRGWLEESVFTMDWDKCLHCQQHLFWPAVMLLYHHGDVNTNNTWSTDIFSALCWWGTGSEFPSLPPGLMTCQRDLQDPAESVIYYKPGLDHPDSRRKQVLGRGPTVAWASGHSDPPCQRGGSPQTQTPRSQPRVNPAGRGPWWSASRPAGLQPVFTDTLCV